MEAEVRLKGLHKIKMILLKIILSTRCALSLGTFCKIVFNIYIRPKSS